MEKINLTDTQALQRLINASKTFVYDIRPVIAYTMVEMGATYQEIGDLLGISKQSAHSMVKSLDDKL